MATHFLKQIAEGNPDLSTLNLHKTTDSDQAAFEETLIKTSEKLTEYTRKERERVWVVEGMARFMETIQFDRTGSDFYDRILKAIVRYCDAVQGGLFMLNENDPEDIHLELKACYAFGRKKFVEKEIGIGQGMLGQCFLEKETAIFTQVPDRYFDITSGLGEAPPKFLMICPLKFDQQVLGVMEIASFEKMPAYKIEFIEKIAENLASVALNIQHGIKADRLYEDSLIKTKRLQEQEEILRQNIEELEATQEEMKRNQTELDARSHLMKFIVDNIPFPIFVKDEKGRYTLVNKSEARLFNLTDEELLGKDDSSFVSNDSEWKMIQESDARVLRSGEPLELPIQHFTTTNGRSYVFKTTKIPFVNNVTGKKNILGVSVDLTEKLDLEKKILREQSINNINTLINVAGRQRMLTQKIAFLAELVIKGKSEKLNDLKEAVDLFEHSLEVMREGGLPNGVRCLEPLPEPQPTLIPYLESVANLWTPYKNAVKKIIFYHGFTKSINAAAKEFELENSINFIEDNAEELLNRNNDLMLICVQLSDQQMSMVE